MRSNPADPAGHRTLDPDLPPAAGARRRLPLGRRRAETVDTAYAEDRRPPRRGAGSAIAGGAGSALLLLARLVRFVTGVIVTVIVAAILLRVLDANSANTIVSNVHDIAKALVGPFDGIFNLKSAKAEIAVNWGLAAVAYLVVGSFIASLLARAGLTGAREERV